MSASHSGFRVYIGMFLQVVPPIAVQGLSFIFIHKITYLFEFQNIVSAISTILDLFVYTFTSKISLQSSFSLNFVAEAKFPNCACDFN